MNGLRMVRFGAASLALLAVHGVAMAADPAADGGHHAAAGGHGPANPLAFPWPQYVAAIVLFGVAFLVLSKTAWPKVMKGLEDRENKIREEIAAAEDARKHADVAMKEYQSKLAEARAEAARLLSETKAEQARLAADLKVKAEAELNELRESARRSIEAAKRAALAEIYGETVALSTQIASKILQRELNPQDQRKLVEETIHEFTGSQMAGTRG